MSRKLHILTLKSIEEQELIEHRDHDPRPYGRGALFCDIEDCRRTLSPLGVPKWIAQSS